MTSLAREALHRLAGALPALLGASCARGSGDDRRGRREERRSAPRGERASGASRSFNDTLHEEWDVYVGRPAS